jgi:hypothetical protein
LGVFILERLYAFLHPLIIKGNALTCLGLRLFPSRLLKVSARSLTRFAKQAIVFVEAVNNDARDIERNLRRQQLRKVLHG